MAQDINGTLTHTIQSQVNSDYPVDGGLGIMPLFIRANELLPAYWSRARDAELSRFWMREDHIASALSMFVSKTASIPIRIIPRDQSIKAHVKQADDLTANITELSDWGKGWASSFAIKMIMSFITQDNGCFAEVLGDGKPDKERRGFYGLANLDPSLCQRTSNPLYPIIYSDIGIGGTGSRYKMHHTRIVESSSLPNYLRPMNNVGFCLDRDAIVMMADGSQRRIVDLVKNKSTELVMSLDSGGSLVEKPITNWYVNPVAGRKMINIRGDKAKLNQGSKQKNSWVTEDHPVLTPNGWRKAGELKTGEAILTGLPTPNEKQIQFLIGTLLGDGSLVTKNYGNNKQYRPRFSMGHAIAQKEWFDLKANALCNDYGFTSRLYDAKIVYLGIEKTFPMYNGQTNAHAGFIELHKAFYPNGKKVIPLDLVRDNFSPLMLATWYLDDGNLIDNTKFRKERQAAYRGGGYYTVEITTTGFEMEQVEGLVDILNEHGYEAYTINVNRTKHAKSIRFLKNGAIKLFNDIAPYVPHSMRYKLPPGAPEFDYRVWNLGQADRLIDKVEIRMQWYKKIQTVYCIDVADTHNFISAGIVVHNCALSRMVHTAQHLLDMATTEQEELGSRPKRRLIIGKKGITINEIVSAFQQADMQMDAQGLSRFSKSVVIASTTKPTANNEIEIDVQDLASVLKGEDKERSITLGMFLIALALNIPPRWLWPATSTGATKADAMYQHIAGMGGGIGHLLQVFTNMLGGGKLADVLGKPVPSHLQVVFDEQDDEQDRQQAEVREIRSKVWTANINTGILDVSTAREQMLDAGDITEQQFDDMELADNRLPDGQDILNLFLTTEPALQEMLSISVGDVLNVKENDADVVLQAIEDKLLEVRAILVNPIRPKVFDQAKQAFAALIALKELYEGAKVTQQIEEGMEDNADEEALPNNEIPPVEEDKPVESVPPVEPAIQKESSSFLNQALQFFLLTRKEQPPVINIHQAPISISTPEHTFNITMPEQQAAQVQANINIPKQEPIQNKVEVNIPKQPAPHFNPTFKPQINMPQHEKESPPVIHFNPQVNVPKQDAPIVNVTPEINLYTPEIESETTEVVRDENGFIKFAKKLINYK